MQEILINSPRFPQPLENDDVKPFYYPMRDYEWMRLFYLIDRQFAKVETCDHSFEKLKTALEFCNTKEEFKKDIQEFVEMVCCCDCEILLNLATEVSDRIDAQKQERKKVEGILEKATTPEERKVIFMRGGPLTGKSLLTNILTKNLSTFRVNGRKLGLSAKRGWDYFILDGAEEKEVIIIDDLIFNKENEKLLMPFIHHLIKNPTLPINRMNKGIAILNIPHIIITCDSDIKGLDFLRFSYLVDSYLNFRDEFGFYDACRKLKIPLKDLPISF